MKYRKKPVVIDADKWVKNGDHPEVGYYRSPDDSGNRVCGKCEWTMAFHGWIDTLEGGHVVCPGDWIIKDIEGGFYPCKPYIFGATYEIAE